MPYDLDVKGLDIDSAGNLLALAKMESTTIKRQVLMRFTPANFMNEWILKYELDSDISFFVDRIRLMPSNDNKVILYTSLYGLATVPHILLVDLPTKKITQKIMVCAD